MKGVDNETWWSNKIKTEVKYPLDSLDMSRNGSKGEYSLLAVVVNNKKMAGK
jgi:hypothetical protein